VNKTANYLRIAVVALGLSAGAFTTWKSSEGFTEVAVIPTKGDVPTIGHGSTKYEDGTPVKLTDPPITRKRGEELARNLAKQDEKRFADTLPGVSLYQWEYDAYIDFVGQFGIGNWNKSSMRKELLRSNYAGACKALLQYRYSAGYDCSTLVNGEPNKRCYGVWTRQQQRYNTCIGAS